MLTVHWHFRYYPSIITLPRPSPNSCAALFKDPSGPSMFSASFTRSSGSIESSLVSPPMQVMTQNPCPDTFDMPASRLLVPEILACPVPENLSGLVAKRRQSYVEERNHDAAGMAVAVS